MAQHRGALAPGCLGLSSTGASPVGSQAGSLCGARSALSALRLEAVSWDGEQCPRGLGVQVADLSRLLSLRHRWRCCLAAASAAWVLSAWCAPGCLPASVPEHCCPTGPCKLARRQRGLLPSPPLGGRGAEMLQGDPSFPPRPQSNMSL